MNHNPDKATHLMSNALAALRSAIADFEMLPFPPVAKTERGIDVHADLAEFDGYIIGLVKSTANGANVDPSTLVMDRSLRDRVDAFAAQADQVDRKVAGEYQRYLDRLQTLIQRAADIIGFQQ
jgi:hypothetical protein